MAGSCEGGWELYNDHCYLVIVAAVAWTEADTACTTTHSAQLASILDLAEQTFVRSIVQVFFILVRFPVL